MPKWQGFKRPNPSFFQVARSWGLAGQGCPAP
jgi:hypothetical protein